MIRKATYADAVQLATTMRPADAAECRASGGYTPLEALHESMRVSDFVHALELGDQVAALWGVAPVGGTLVTGPAVGVLWALTSTAVDRHRKSFAATSSRVILGLQQLYPVLTNMVDARYTDALRWARWLGFEVHPARPFGFEQRLFHPIVLRRPHV